MTEYESGAEISWLVDVPDRMFLHGWCYHPELPRGHRDRSRFWFREMTPKEVALERSLREAGVERDFDYSETPREEFL